MTPTVDVRALLKIPTGKEVYDGLMSRINPSLMSDQLPHLDDSRAGETPDARKARYRGYLEDFAKYDRAYDEWLSRFHRGISQFRRAVVETAERSNRTEESGSLLSIESAIAA
jgi:hypothetical protein